MACGVCLSLMGTRLLDQHSWRSEQLPMLSPRGSHGDAIVTRLPQRSTLVIKDCMQDMVGVLAA